MDNKTQSYLILYHLATTEDDYAVVRELFLAYEKDVGFKMDFQNFHNELQELNKQYGPPKGVVFLAYNKNKPIGCIALRELEDTIGEIKRMYVEPGFRNRHIGQRLLHLVLRKARILGYKKLRLDTLKKMKPAVRLYRAAGFYEIEAYRFNPFDDALFMEKIL